MRERLRAGMPFFGFLACPAITLVLTECYTHNPFKEMALFPWLLNLVLYWILAACLLFITGRLRWALQIQTLLLMLAGLANYYVMEFRDSPILPWDIYSLGTAASVADNFSYALPQKVWAVLIGFAALLGAEQLFVYRIRQTRTRIVGAVAMSAALIGFGAFLQQEDAVKAMKLYDKMFTPDVVQRRNGLAAAFTMELKYLKIERPGGYDAEECEALLESYQKSEDAMGTGAAEKQPHIIVIMNEAFSDMSYLGDFDTNQEYMPFISSLMGAENTISGRLHVSVLGGNTANTEFEFLTGNTMAFMPLGSIPYQQYIHGQQPSLASELKQAGYATVAMHPYYESGWSRNKVYPWMGFDSMRFIEDYENAEYVRKYVSDAADFERLIAEYESRDREKPLFLFNVTMQNHGGYGQEFDNFKPDIEAQGIKSRSLSNYLSLISLTDQALAKLVAYFEQEQEEVLLVFFGDHQPNDTVAAPIWKANGVDYKNLTEEQENLRYEVPFVIWANYDIEEKSDVETSANFLALEVLKQSGIERNGYYRYLEELQRQYPVISSRQVKTKEGMVLPEEERGTSEELLTYQKLQYYQMFEMEKE